MVDCKSYFDVATLIKSYGWFSFLGHSKMKNLWHGTLFYCYFLALALKRTKSDFITWVTSHCHYMAVKPIHNPFIQCHLTYCQSYVLLGSTISTKTSFNLVLHGTLFQHGSVWVLFNPRLLWCTCKQFIYRNNGPKCKYRCLLTEQPRSELVEKVNWSSWLKSPFELLDLRVRGS